MISSTIQVSENNSEILVISNTWYFIMAVTVPGLMTLGGNYLFDFHLSVSGTLNVNSKSTGIVSRAEMYI